MNKRIISIVVIATILLSLTAFVPTINAASPETNTKLGLSKLAPNLQSEIAANPNSECRIEVILKEGSSKSNTLDCVKKLGGKINAQHSIINAVSVSLPAGKIVALASLIDVDEILIDGKKCLIPTPQSDDSGAAIENYLKYGYWYAQFPFWIGADKVWQMGIDGADVVVADLDTGIFLEHPDLAGVVIDYKVFTSELDAFPHDGHGHGTATTGCVAAQGIETYYGFFKVLGVAPGAKVIGGKVLTDEGWGWDSWIIAGIEWAVQRGANIITMSLGGLEVPNNGKDPTALALDAATKKGVTCFVAAGNDQGSVTVGSPGVAKDVVTVGASTESSGPFWVYGYWPEDPASGYENDQIIFWSSGGPTADSRLDPDVCAIGAWGETLDTYPYYLFLQFGGTSMATPVAAGVGALVLQAYKQAHGVFPSPAVARKILMNTAKDLGYPANRQGAGRVDAEKAVLAAMSELPYSNTDEINTGILSPCQSYATMSVFTDNIDSAYATRLEMCGSTGFDSLSIPTGNTYLDLEVPAGVEYMDIRVKFAPEVTYGSPIHSYDGSTWTDVHINTALYRVEDGNLILLNYAYAHTNVQWFDSRVTAGSYALRLWNSYPDITPVDVEVNFYKFVAWNWLSTGFVGKNLLTTVSVPKATVAGSYSGFVKVVCSGEPITLPVVVTVPAKLGQTFYVEANVVNEPRAYASGDWFYVPVQVLAIGNIMLTVDWTHSDADFDVFLINPKGEARAISVAPSVPNVLPGGGGRYWYTTTGTTTEMLSTLCLQLGYWYVGIHAIYFGNTFSQTLTVSLDLNKPIDVPDYLSLKKGTDKTFIVSNKIPGNVEVETMALSFQTEHFAERVAGTVYSYDGVNVGYDGWLIPVTPDITTFTVSLSWVGKPGLNLILWDPAGRNVGQTVKSGETLTVKNPAVGWWTAIITIGEPGSQAYTMTVGGLRFKPLKGITVQPSTFTLPAYGTQTLTVTATRQASGLGQIVYYNLATGSTYARTLLTITR